MNQRTKDATKLLIESSKTAIKNNATQQAFKLNPHLPEEIKATGVIKIKAMLPDLKNQHAEIMPFVTSIKAQISAITDQTINVAIYLLLSYNLQIWKSFFILAESGQYSAAFTLIREIKEISMQAQHLILESKKGLNNDLTKWFSGEIIAHSIGRKSTTSFIEEDEQYSDLDLISLQSFIYHMESLNAHASYVSILECISPFTKDFDHSDYTGYHRTPSVLAYAKGSMSDLNITIKLAYLFLFNDHKNYEKLDKILIKYDPTIKNSIDPKIQKEFNKKL